MRQLENKIPITAVTYEQMDIKGHFFYVEDERGKTYAITKEAYERIDMYSPDRQMFIYSDEIIDVIN